MFSGPALTPDFEFSFPLDDRDLVYFHFSYMNVRLAFQPKYKFTKERRLTLDLQGHASIV